MRTLIAATALLALCAAVTGAMAQDAATNPEPPPAAAPAEPVTVEDTGVTIFKSASPIRTPRIIEVDGTVSCRIDGDTLRCTARRPAIPEKE